MFQLVLFLFSLAGLLIATYTDLKERIVPNKLSYALIASGLLLNSAFAFLLNDWLIAAFSLGAAAYGFCFACLLYKIGAWAGGDVKLFTGLAALNPVNPFLLGALGIVSGEMFAPVALPVFPVSLFVFSIFSMLPVTVFLILKRSYGNRPVFMGFVRDLAAMGVLAVAWLYFNTSAFAGLLLLLLAVVLVYFVFRMMIASRVFLRKAVKISELREGEIPAETIAESNGKIERKQFEGMKSFINNVQHYKLAGKTRVIANSMRARGVTLEEIAELGKLVREGKLEDRIFVKESAPMVPAIMAGYILLNLVGDLLWHAVLG